MNILLVLSCIIIGILTIHGYRAGFVKTIVPIISGMLTLILLGLLQNWLLGFLFRWAVFQGEHILARVVLILLIFLMGTLAFKWVFGLLKLLTKLPIVHGLNKLLGLFLGALEGFLAVWLILYFIQMNHGLFWGYDFSYSINESSFLNFLYAHNLIAHLMTTLFGSWII